ncbi:hypothetical protein MJ699_15480 [Klebsiella pneumoniae]|nr:hypothetical protein MJ699_15480 [Klebsiella pneumoniae]
MLQEGQVWCSPLPMVNQGDSRIKTKKDGWTVVTRDKNPRNGITCGRHRQRF